MSRITTAYNRENFTRDIERVCAQIALNITPRIMHVADSYIIKIKEDKLV